MDALKVGEGWGRRLSLEELNLRKAAFIFLVTCPGGQIPFHGFGEEKRKDLGFENKKKKKKKKKREVYPIQ